MKKYIFTEQQVQKIINNTILEQTEEQKQVKNIQEFLNKIYPRLKLTIDGLYGEKTKKAVKQYQRYLNNLGSRLSPSNPNYKNNNIIVDGIWGINTENAMPKNHKEIYDEIKNKNDDFIGRTINKIKDIFNEDKKNMKRKFNLTETELKKIIRKIIKENDQYGEFDMEYPITDSIILQISYEATESEPDVGWSGTFDVTYVGLKGLDLDLTPLFKEELDMDTIHGIALSNYESNLDSMYDDPPEPERF